MGCTNSKVNELPAVCLCRERCGFLEEAVRQRYALAEVHAAYLHSLKAVGASLDLFFSRDLWDDGGDDSSSSSPPVPNLPPRGRKGEPTDKIHHQHSHPHSDDGLEGNTDGSKDMHRLHRGENLTSPAKPANLPGGVELMNVSYMKKNQATPSVTYTQRPATDTETTMNMGESSSSYFSYRNPYPKYDNTDNNSYENPSPAASTAPPPPPPPPPTSSNWDFLNPFESIEPYKYNPSYPRSQDYREVREEEGIPDLEDENESHRAVEEILEDQKFADRPEPPPEEAVRVVDKKVVGEPKDRGRSSGAKPRAGDKLKGDIDSIRELRFEFERASESGAELAEFLEVEKLPRYKRKHSFYHVSHKFLRFPLPSSAFKGSDGADDVDQEMDLRSKTLSSILHKLHLWEKKLHEEVKVEEKMRTLHERKSQKLKLLDEKGAEAHKVDKTKALVRSLSAKINIAIQVIDKISVKINALRDDELWPQLHEFIKRLAAMWESMLECSRNQCRAIAEAKQLGSIALGNQISEAHLEATRRLEHDVVDWAQRFSDWIGSQKDYVRSMRRWLTKCLLYVPEETLDGIVPFSPGRIGAPPIFVACNHWWQSLDRISEREAVDSVRDFASNVLRSCDGDGSEEIRRTMTDGDEVYRGENAEVLRSSLRRALEATERFAASSLEAYEELLRRIESESSTSSSRK